MKVTGTGEHEVKKRQMNLTFFLSMVLCLHSFWCVGNSEFVPRWMSDTMTAGGVNGKSEQKNEQMIIKQNSENILQYGRNEKKTVGDEEILSQEIQIKSKLSSKISYIVKNEDVKHEQEQKFQTEKLRAPPFEAYSGEKL